MHTDMTLKTARNASRETCSHSTNGSVQAADQVEVVALETAKYCTVGYVTCMHRFVYAHSSLLELHHN